MNQIVPVQVLATSRSAVWQPRPGRKPWRAGERRLVVRLEQQTDHLTDELVAPGWQPSGRIFPFFFGMYTRRAGANWYRSGASPR